MSVNGKWININQNTTVFMSDASIVINMTTPLHQTSQLTKQEQLAYCMRTNITSRLSPLTRAAFSPLQCAWSQNPQNKMPSTAG